MLMRFRARSRTVSSHRRDGHPWKGPSAARAPFGAVVGRPCSSRLTRLLVVGCQVLPDERARAMRVVVARHVVTAVRHILLHVVAQLVEARGGDQVALAVDLPRDGRVARAE